MQFYFFPFLWQSMLYIVCFYYHMIYGCLGIFKGQFDFSMRFWKFWKFWSRRRQYLFMLFWNSPLQLFCGTSRMRVKQVGLLDRRSLLLAIKEIICIGRSGWRTFGVCQSKKKRFFRGKYENDPPHYLIGTKSCDWFSSGRTIFEQFFSRTNFSKNHTSKNSNVYPFTTESTSKWNAIVFLSATLPNL